MRRREIVGVDSAEDIVLIPGSEWVITGAMTHDGASRPTCYFINIRTHELRPAWPDNVRLDLDRERFGDVEPPRAYNFHGLDVIQRGSVIEVYQVNHAPHGASDGRESVEVFEIDLTPGGPALRWRGAVISISRMESRARRLEMPISSRHGATRSWSAYLARTPRSRASRFRGRG